MPEQPSTNDLLDDVSLDDTNERSNPKADFEIDGISAEEMADDAEQQAHQDGDRHLRHKADQ